MQLGKQCSGGVWNYLTASCTNFGHVSAGAVEKSSKIRRILCRWRLLREARWAALKIKSEKVPCRDPSYCGKLGEGFISAIRFWFLCTILKKSAQNCYFVPCSLSSREQLDPHQSPVTSPPPAPRRASRSTRPSKSCHKVRPSPPLTAAAAPAQMLVHSSSLTRPGHSTALENRWNRCPVNKAEMGRFGEGMMKLHQMPINMQCEIFSTKSFWQKSYLNHLKLLFIRTILAYRASSHISYHMPYQQREVEMLISGSRTLCLVKIGQF